MEREDLFRSSGHGRGEIKEERREIDSSLDLRHQENCRDEIKSKDGNKLASAKAEMDEAREENRRLKLHLSKIVKDYETLQTQYNQIVQQETEKFPEGHEEIKESELVSLSLGRKSSPVSSGSRTKEEKNKAVLMVGDHVVDERERSRLGLDCRVGKADEKAENEKQSLGNNNQSPESSFGSEEMKEEAERGGGEANQSIWSAGNAKTMRNDGEDHEDVLQQNPVKRARVSVRARCDTPTMNDGCQWRKYGQKIAKGNPCPRAYYRCTVAPSCPVRKQVQRCAEDMSILITTYEGTHNHPLPMSATAMASTTSAAASMLLSGATSSSAATTNLRGLNFYLSDNSSKPKPFYLPTSSSSSSSSHPTITLDLTTSAFSNPSSSSSSSSSSSPLFHSYFNRFSSSGIANSFLQAPRSYPSTNLNFSGNTVSSPLESNNGMHWSSNSHFLSNYGNTNMGNSHQLPYHMIEKRTTSGAFNQFGISSQPIQSNVATSSSSDIFQSLIHKNIQLSSAHPTPFSQPCLQAETIKAITADPSFQSALATVLSSIIGGDRSIGGGQTGNLGQKPKREVPLTIHDMSSYSAAALQSDGCSLSSVSKLPSSSAAASRQLENMKFLPYSGSRSESVSPSDTKEQSS